MTPYIHTYVAHDTLATFWFGDLIWPDLNLNLTYLYATFFMYCEVSWQRLGYQVLLFPYQLPKSDISGLWPSLDLTCDLLSFLMLKNALLRVFDCRLVPSLRSSVLVLGGGGGPKLPPPPLPQRAGRVHANAGRGLTDSQQKCASTRDSMAKTDIGVGWWYYLGLMAGLDDRAWSVIWAW